MELIIQIISAVYNFLWGDLFTIPLPGGNSMGVSLLVLLLIPTGIYFTIRTRAMPLRLFPEMLRVTVEKRSHSHLGSISGVQALVVSTAHPGGNGEPGGRGGCHLRRRSRSGILDVDLRTAGVLHRLYRGHLVPTL